MTGSADILEALEWIARAIVGRSEADFLADETLCYLDPYFGAPAPGHSRDQKTE